MKKAVKIFLIGLALFGISSIATFSWKVNLPQDFDTDYLDRASVLCKHSFGFPLKLSTWENHCLRDDSIILSHIINLIAWVVIAGISYIVVVNYKKIEAKLGKKGFIWLPLILLLCTAVAIGVIYILSFFTWVYTIDIWKSIFYRIF